MNGSEADETLPFDVERERLPYWAHAASALVILVGGLVAVGLMPMLALLPFLVVSSLGRRFASSAVHVEVAADGLHLGSQRIPSSEIVDVWVDPDRSEPRATVARDVTPSGETRSRRAIELCVLCFENVQQARRFGDALAETLPASRMTVTGHEPRPLDFLASLRFVAIAAAFWATGSPYGAFVLVFFALGAWPIVRAKQLTTAEESFELRGLFGAAAYSYEGIERVDTDAGVIAWKDGRELELPRSTFRDTTLACPAWLERARARVLDDIRARRSARAT